MNVDSVLVPCDAVLLRGTCLVNEAMLTGESVPQVKEGLTLCEDLLVPMQLGRDSLWRRHIVYGGTTIVQYNTDHADHNNIPDAPDGGILALAIRTGFGTEQVSALPSTPSVLDAFDYLDFGYLYIFKKGWSGEKDYVR